MQKYNPFFFQTKKVELDRNLQLVKEDIKAETCQTERGFDEFSASFLT